MIIYVFDVTRMRKSKFRTVWRIARKLRLVPPRVLSAGKTYPRFFYLAFGAVDGKAFVGTHFVLPRNKIYFRVLFQHLTPPSLLPSSQIRYIIIYLTMSEPIRNKKLELPTAP